MPAAVLAAMAVIAVGAYAWWGEQAGWDGGRAMTAEEAAQEIMLRGMRAIAAAREAAGFPIDRRIDPNGTGLIGVEWSIITTTLGNLEAKRTATHPAWAGVVVRWMREAGVEPGDTVWAAFSGSFPGLNLAVLAAAEAMGVRLLAVSSLGASTWGANLPGFTWAAMEAVLREQGIVGSGSVAVTLGGDEDRGIGLLFDEGLDALRAAAQASGLPFLEPESLEHAVALRLQVLEAESGGRPPALFINVGGSHASLGSCPDSERWPAGLTREARPCPGGVPGMLHVMSQRGVPVLHLLNVRELAVLNGIPIDARFEVAPVSVR
ncbi:MAG TPA: poly-gamma-glutamate system protein [Limnochordales bacterium]